MFFRHQRSDKDHAVYVVQPERFQIFHFPFRVVSGVRQQHLITGVVDNLCDAVHHSADGF